MFLDDDMVKESMVAREINFEEKRVHVPTPVTQKQQVSQYLLMLYD